MSKPLNLIPYFGGKTRQLDWLKDHLPIGRYHFVDGLCGSGSVALNVDYPLITVNDLNDDIINLFFQLRNREHEFIELIKRTPYSKHEYYQCCEPTEDDLERARRTFVRAMQGFAGNGSQNDHKAWGREIKIQDSDCYRVTTWNKRINQLPELIDKLRSFQIENMNVLELIEKYDRPSTIIYLDPPYVRATRADRKRYRFEMTDNDHIDLADKANACECMVAVSGYYSDLYAELFPAGKWNLIKAKESRQNTANKATQECLWINYPVPERTIVKSATTMDLFTSTQKQA